jgi:hypothetical protein
MCASIATRGGIGGPVRLLDIDSPGSRGTTSRFPAGVGRGALGARHVLTNIWTRDRSFATDAFGVLCDLARPLDQPSISNLSVGRLLNWPRQWNGQATHPPATLMIGISLPCGHVIKPSLSFPRNGSTTHT